MENYQSTEREQSMRDFIDYVTSTPEHASYVLSGFEEKLDLLKLEIRVIFTEPESPTKSFILREIAGLEEAIVKIKERMSEKFTNYKFVEKPKDFVGGYRYVYEKIETPQ